MAPPLAESDRLMLIKLLGMLGSAFDGECVNAARLADRLMRERGLRWEQVIGGVVTVVQPGPVYQQPPPPQSVAAKIDFVFKSSLHLTAWEIQFLTDIRSRSMLSERQEQVLGKILRKARWPDEDDWDDI